jgi:2-octaprenyl-6-methoxyphenol hydroxylase
VQRSARSVESVDVLIGGAGFAGLALAIALRQSLGRSFSIVVVDPAAASVRTDPRASAIVAAARRLFETIGVWDEIEAQPITDMVVTDSRLDDVVRPVFLSFDGDVEPGRPFADMIENGPLLAALARKADAEGIARRPAAVVGLNARAAGGAQSASPAGRRDTSPRGWSHVVETELSDGGAIAARLLVAADGAHSVIREHLGIASHGWSYGQSAIVTTVAHERDHGGRALEHFLPAGPFAILPLTRHPSIGHRSSIVWTEETSEAQRIAALPDAQFHAELERRFGLQLGEIAAVGPRRVHPLGLAMARAFIAERVALVGDAAHVIHPIAGQGLNMGLKDVAALAEVIVDAVRLGLDHGSPAVLERYQRWRRFDTLAMGLATDSLNRLFSNGLTPLRLVRDLGLGVVDRLPALKDLLIRQAAGISGEVPRLLRGEAL